MQTGTVPKETFDSVTGYLSWDHERLETLLEVARRSVAAGGWAEAAPAQSMFEHGLLRHIRLEEEIVFPLFEARTGIVDGPTAVMREEHRCLQRAVAMMSAAVENEDAAAYGEALAFLETVRPAHNAKEVRILYPMTDRLLAPRDRATVAARLQRE